jgi:GDP-L-fucose synthase
LDKNDRIFVAGSTGLVGRAIVRALQSRGHSAILAPTHSELDLCDAKAVLAFLHDESPRYVFLAAGRVGGIYANLTAPADFIHINLAIAQNVIHGSYRAGVRKLVNLGSSCIYPRDAPQPISENALLSGPLESTNRAYAVAKIAAIEMCDAYRRQYNCDFISAMPTNLYGPYDNFDPKTSHVVPALIRKIVDAKNENLDMITLWGTGMPRRELLYVDDLADALLVLTDLYSEPGPINIGTGDDIRIHALANEVAEVVEWKGEIRYDPTKPDGTPRKLLDISKMQKLGWKAETSLQDGLRATVEWYTT